MVSPARSLVVIRFGAFELDAAAGELRKSGILLKLHPQPLRVLLLLAERPGQIVTREEIRHCLWGDNTFVDFERGINFCVNQIRSVMGDDAEHPRYIETLPRRGYRFIASVTSGEPARDAASSAHPLGARAESKVAATESREPGSAHELRISRSRLFLTFVDRWSRRTVAAAIIAFSAIAVLIAGAVFYFHRPPKLTEKDSIVLADFTNTTGDAVFDDALKQALAVELGQSPFLNVVSETKASETLKMMGRPMNARVTPNIARELCLRTGSKAVLAGSISSLGSHYLVDVDAVACSNGDTLAKEQFEAASKDEILKALSRAASNIRAKLGESLPSVQKFDVPFEATTTSLEALKSFSMGLKIASVQGDAPSNPFLKRAVELDPNFPMASAVLAAHYSNLNEPSLALEYATKAYELRDRVTEREKLLIEFIYFRITGELEKQAQLFDLWMAEYPRDPAPHVSLGVNFAFMGQYDKALAESQTALQLGSENASLYENLADVYLAIDRLDAAKGILNRAQTKNLDSAGLHWMRYYLAFLQGDFAQMERQVAWAAGKPGAEDILLSAQSDTEAYYGRLSNARNLSRRAVDSAVRADSKEAAALWQVNAAFREAEFGEATESKNEVREALALAPGRNVKIFAALALARAGETTQASAIANELERNYASNTVLRLYRLPSINAAIALRKGNSSQALEQLEIVKPYELGQPTPSPLGTLYPVFLRGQAYLSMRDGSTAAAEFQKVLDHPGIALNFPLGPLARLNLGRAYSVAGNADKARAAYEDFFALWKDADPDVPILRQAKAEYAKLK
jgi:DNA-binding winged helix-turn-helix (wHTH) protein/Tfp pilus assembly protein PilF/TolB-like protein